MFIVSFLLLVVQGAEPFPVVFHLKAFDHFGDALLQTRAIRHHDHSVVGSDLVVAKTETDQPVDALCRQGEPELGDLLVKLLGSCFGDVRLDRAGFPVGGAGIG